MSAASARPLGARSRASEPPKSGLVACYPREDPLQRILVKPYSKLLDALTRFALEHTPSRGEIIALQQAAALKRGAQAKGNASKPVAAPAPVAAATDSGAAPKEDGGHAEAAPVPPIDGQARGDSNVRPRQDRSQQWYTGSCYGTTPFWPPIYSQCYHNGWRYPSLPPSPRSHYPRVSPHHGSRF